MVKQQPASSDSSTPLGRRAVQAAETRAVILKAARRLFARRGYPATSLKDVAAEAGVSVQTVYDSVGPKAELIRRLNDELDAEVQIGELVAPIADESDPLVVARLPARIARRFVERCGDVVRASVSGAHVDDSLSKVIAEGRSRHRAGSRMIAGKLASLGALRSGLDADDAARTIAALADVQVALMLHDDYGFSYERLEQWIADVIVDVVLEASPPSASARTAAAPRRRKSTS